MIAWGGLGGIGARAWAGGQNGAVSYAARTKYDEPGRARRYRDRDPRRDEEEWALLARALDRLPEPPRNALDVPCGTGRVAERLIERGVPTRAADLSAAMRRETEQRLGGRDGFLGAAALDLENSSADGLEAADLVVCFRFLHHVPDARGRARVLHTLARLTRRDLLLSFHHPVSVHNLARAGRRLLTGRRGDRHAQTAGRLRREASAAGLTLQGVTALGAWRRDLWLAWLTPSGGGHRGVRRG